MEGTSLYLSRLNTTFIGAAISSASWNTFDFEFAINMGGTKSREYCPVQRKVHIHQPKNLRPLAGLDTRLKGKGPKFWSPNESVYFYLLNHHITSKHSYQTSRPIQKQGRTTNVYEYDAPYRCTTIAWATLYIIYNRWIACLVVPTFLDCDPHNPPVKLNWITNAVEHNPILAPSFRFSIPWYELQWNKVNQKPFTWTLARHNHRNRMDYVWKGWRAHHLSFRSWLSGWAR